MVELLEALTHRRARRSFAATAVPAEVRDALWRAVQVAPSHGNAQPTRIIVAGSDEARARLIHALSAGNQSWAPAAPLLFALAAIPGHDAVFESSTGETRELWAFHAGIAAANLMAQATEMGLIAHPMASFDEAEARTALSVPPAVRLLVVFAAGYPGAADALPEDLQRRERSSQERLPMEHLVANDCWDAALGVSARDVRSARRG